MKRNLTCHSLIAFLNLLYSRHYFSIYNILFHKLCGFMLLKILNNAIGITVISCFLDVVEIVFVFIAHNRIACYKVPW